MNRKLLALPAFTCVLLPEALWAQAQTPTAPTDVVVVTGTRLPAPNLVSTSPIQVVSSGEIKMSGRTDISDVLQLMPQSFSNDLGQDLGNRTSGLTTAGGVSTADLRGLGPNRTLVLVNGRRLGNGSPYTAIQSPAPDLDQIPARLIERADVVTGGASAVYGSDAIAGVVNFILKKDFDGIEIDLQSGFNMHENDAAFPRQMATEAGFDAVTGSDTDGQNVSYSVIAGANSDSGRGNFTVYLGYQDQDPVRSDQRDFGAGQLATDTDANGVPTGGVFMTGSSNSNRFQPQSGPLGNDPTAVFGVSGNSFVPFGSDTTPPAIFNSQKDIYMSRQYKRYTGGMIGHYDLNDYVKPYVEFGFMNDRTHQEIAPSGLFRSSNPLTADGHYLINCSNPLLSAQQRNIICSPQEILDDSAPGSAGTASASVEIGRRNIEGGGRTSDYEHTNYRAVFGATGDISPNWSYDAYGQYYYVQFYNSNNRYLNFEKISNALQVTTDPLTGDPVCISGSPCVPWNIFADGGVTQDALNYMYTNGTNNGTTELRTAHVDFTGVLDGVKLPSADEGMSVNFGYESRSENVHFDPDAAQLSGLLSGAGGASVSIHESVSVDEFFGEVRLPLVQDKRGVVDLSVDVGFRESDYSTVGKISTSKFEIQYAPVESLRLRASVNEAIRAPSIIELFNPQLVGQIGIGNDPCAPTLDQNNVLVPAVNSLTECLRTVRPDQAAAFTAAYGNGSTTNQIEQGTASQLSQLQGGNQSLTPETADTYSIGVTITPERLSGFTASVDYWNIELENGVGTLPAGVILNSCPDTGDPVFCSQLVRQPTTFSLKGASVQSGGYILQNNQNVASGESSGIDIQMSYQIDLQGGSTIGLALAGSYMLDNSSTPYAGAHTYDCTGLFGATCQTVNPEWRHVLRTTWQLRTVATTLTWRHIDAVSNDNNDPDPTLNQSSFAGYDIFNATIGSHDYLDLAATFSPGEKVELRAGINNLTDKDPPFLTSEIVGGGSPNTYSTYDMFGRQIFLAVNVRL